MARLGSRPAIHWGHYMKYPEMLILPALMFADYLLTIVSAKAKDNAYGRYFKQQHLELNPIWQKDVGALRWINPRHITIALLLSAAIIYLFEFGQLPKFLATGFKGYIFALYACVVGRHISNLFIFRYIRTHEGVISGEVLISHRLLLAISSFQLITVILPLLALAILTPKSAVLGANLGIAFLITLHGYWYYRAAKTENLQALRSNDT